MKTELIAPCGMNCHICSAYLREKNNCPGCRLLNKKEPVSMAKCRIKNCENFKRGTSQFCFQCKDFPCARIKHLDKRYTTKYNMSMVENLEDIKKEGMEKFLIKQKKKWTCQKCGGTVCCHSGNCYDCESDKLIKKNSTVTVPPKVKK